MQEKIPFYDLILVYTSFRRHETYLNIAKALGQSYSVGIYVCQPQFSWQETEHIAIEMYKQFGAEVVEGRAQCSALMLSRFGDSYFKEIFQELPKRIRYSKLFVQTGTLMGGVLSLRDICESMKPPVILAPCIKHFGLYETESLEYLKQHPVEMVEVGQPFAKHPVFDSFKTDYLVAYPSHVSIVNNFQHYCLVKNITTVLFSLPSDAAIYVKPHNVRDKGNRISVKLTDRKIFSMFKKNKLPMPLIKAALRLIYLADLRLGKFKIFKLLPGKLLSLVVGLQNDYVFSRCKNLLDYYPAFGIEHFMKGVSKGVITGLSNTIFAALMHKVPICICDPFSDDRPPNYQTMITELGIDRWKGFSTEGFTAIDDSTREADLIEHLRSFINKQSLQARKT